MKKNSPFVSVILPIRNETAFIKRSLEAVLGQDYPAASSEVIVVDGDSDDGTQDLVREFQKKYSNLRLLNNPKRIVAPGLNLGIREAKGEVIVRVDGHTLIAKDYVRQCVECLQRTDAWNVGGKMTATAQSFVGQAVVLATSSRFGVGGARFHYSDKEEWADTVYLGAWRKEVFDKIGYFDEELVRNQDDELNYRLRKAGGKILLSPGIRSEYFCRSSLKSLWKQYFEYGYWKVRVLQKHPRQMQWRQFVPPVFVASLLMMVILSSPNVLVGDTLDSRFRGNDMLGAMWFVFLGAYTGANLIASASLSAKKGWRYFLILPLVFAILHVSYGSGFLLGLIRFSGRWKNPS